MDQRVSLDSGTGEERQTSSVFWMLARDIYRRRILILGVTVVAAAVSVLLAFMLPVWYKASTSVVLPRTTGRGALTAVLGQLGSMASAILGGGVGDYTRYLSILESRTMMEAVVDEFGLVEVYETGKAPNPRGEAVEVLRGNVDFYVDAEFEFLRVSAFDRDPNRAANMANYFVTELNRRNAELLSGQARAMRMYLEERYQAAETALAAARDSMQSFQERFGIVQLEAQTEAYLNMVAKYRADAVLAEIEYQALRLDFGDENPVVESARLGVQAARTKGRQLQAGGDALMPVAFSKMPEVARRYSELLQEVLIESTIVDFARPLVEQAYYDEQKQTQSVQVLDAATVPLQHAKPRRTAVAVGITLSVLMLAVLYVLGLEWWRRHHARFATRLEQALSVR